MNIDQLFHQAVILHQSGRLSEAENLYALILRQKSKHPGALHHLGLISQAKGNLPEARRLINAAIKAEPRYGEAYNSLGTIEAKEGRLKDAAQLFARAASLKPGYVQALINQSRALLGLGQLREAKEICQKIIVLAPQNPEIYTNLGIIFVKEKNYEKAREHFLRALEIAPDMLAANLNLGSCWVECNQPEKGIPLLQKVLEKEPRNAQAHYNIGVGLSKNKDYDAAIDYFIRACDSDPTFADAWNNLGIVLNERGRVEEAVAKYNQALALQPNNPEYLCNLGMSLKLLSRNDEAKAALGKALEINPGLDRARMIFANILKQEGEIDAALAEYLSLIAENPDVGNIWYNLGNAYLAIGEIVAAENAYAKAFDIYPQSDLTWRSFITSFLYNPEYSCADLFAKQEEIAKKVAPPACGPRPRPSALTSRKLKVAYVSSDFRLHPVARNMLPIFANHDRENFEIYAYADVARPDFMSQEIEGHCDKWVNISGISDQKAAELIRQDEIDILVILAARFDFNRPLIACHGPAPVIVSMHDPATLALPGIDYLIGDVFLNPKASNEKFSEKVIRLPTFYLHEPIKGAPAVSSLPWEKNGFITFGCFNNPAKISNQVLRLWKKILDSVPNSRLILKYQGSYHSKLLRKRIIDVLENENVLFVAGNQAAGSHLEIYNQVDVALDPFPFSGSTTSFEAVYMGVPVVTLAGETMVSRWTGMIENALGLQDFIAHCSEEYCRIAINMDQEKLKSLRQNLRDKVDASPLCSAKRRARHLEMIYRAIIKPLLIN